jgi:hypothetical protein
MFKINLLYLLYFPSRYLYFQQIAEAGRRPRQNGSWRNRRGAARHCRLPACHLR